MHTEDILVTFFHEMPRWHRDQIRELLEQCDGEFVPPISKRSVPWQAQISDDGFTDGIEIYLRSMDEESFLIMTDSDKNLAAFMSYIPGHTHPEETDGEPTNYVTTICVRPDCRRRGLAKRLYHILETFVSGESITVKTWLTNDAHVRLLDSLGYAEWKRVSDDRGEGIDTVYYRLQTERMAY